MRIVLIVCLFFISNAVFAMHPRVRRSIDSVIVDFDRALLAKDSMQLERMLDDNCTYGHSNGWIETRQEVVSDLFNGKLTYKQITATGKDIKVRGKVAVVRMKADVDVVVSNTPVHVKLSILQVWRWKHKRWLLVARQSAKI